MYSTRRIDWAYQEVNQSWSAKVLNGSDLEKQGEEEEAEQEQDEEEEEEEEEGQ